MFNDENLGTILYVEDDPNNRTLIRRILGAEGYTVHEAANASIALEKLKTLKPDLILMDINMPEVDGYTLTAQIRAIPEMSNVPIVALTANVMKGDRERSLQAGCDGYIQKPIDIDTIATQIQRFMKR
ncbi:MAG: response regulator [Anaerolineae bacterium]|nr:MAG: response regulator [Anaerolineae bacterium]